MQLTFPLEIRLIDLLPPKPSRGRPGDLATMGDFGNRPYNESTHARGGAQGVFGGVVGWMSPLRPYTGEQQVSCICFCEM